MQYAGQRDGVGWQWKVSGGWRRTMTRVSCCCEEISKVVFENEGPETIVRTFG
jgi:hypothetical protein